MIRYIFIILIGSMISFLFLAGCEGRCICPLVYEPVCGEDGETYDNICYAECENVEVAYEGECEEECICPAVYEPVCGEDGETYSNECYAECEGVEIAHEGECGEEEECYCPAIYEPVCGEDGVTYGNECEAECAGVEVAYEGECEEEESLELEMSATEGGTTSPGPGIHIYEEVKEITAEALPDEGYEFLGWEKEGSTTECEEEEKECTFTINEDSLLAAHFIEKDEEDCICLDVYEPVCGEDGETYSNECYAECAGVEVAYEGECEEEEECYCPTVYEPVCGEDGETYSNECYAECAGVEVAYEGECEEEEECYCPTVYEPVCGEDGVTYGNDCEADCAGVEVAYEGECEEYVLH